MDTQKVDAYISSNIQYFEARDVHSIKQRMLAIDDSKYAMIESIKYKNPTVSLILSILLGSLGVDRFYVGDIGIGLAKLFTMGGFFIWQLIDIFMIVGVTKKKNMDQVRTYMY
jgi:TM2 domain-containing membrane protein YozV